MIDHRQVLFLFISLTLLACGSGGGDSSDRVLPPDNVSGPVIPYTQGEPAIISNLGRVQPVISYFEKRYNRPDLEAVLRASSQSTVNYVRALGAALYRAPRPARKPAPIYFVSLSLPPVEFDSLWKSVSGNQNEGELVAGLYFDACQFNTTCRDDRVVRPTILVDEAGDRWTLVHEMMHFAFDRQRKVDHSPGLGTLRVQLSNARQRMLAAVQRYDSSGQYGDLAESATLLSEVTQLTYLRTTVQELEETTVEALLVDEWGDHKFLNVPLHSVQNAVWYMNDGRKEALKLFQPLVDALQAVKLEAKQKAWGDISARCQTTLTFIQQLRTNTLNIVRRAEQITGFQLREARLQGFAQAAPAPLQHQVPSPPTRMEYAAGENRGEGSERDSDRDMDHSHVSCMGNTKDRAEWLSELDRIKKAAVYEH